MADKLTQSERVVQQLNANGAVTNFWAIDNYILRLGAIICQLKKEGWDFETGYSEGQDRKNFKYTVKSKPSGNIIPKTKELFK